MDFPPPAPPQNRAPRRSSAEAEELVAGLLRRQGWVVLARNFRHIGCELDIVARKGGTVVAVEVKARRGAARPEDLLPWRKRAALVRGLTRFVGMRGLDFTTLRLDLAVVRPQGIDYQVNV